MHIHGDPQTQLFPLVHEQDDRLFISDFQMFYMMANC